MAKSNMSELISPIDVENKSVPAHAPVDEMVSPVKVTEFAKEVKKTYPVLSTQDELEAYLSLATSLLATPIAGWNGIETALLESLGFKQDITPTEAINLTAEALTYEPSTEAGKRYLDFISTPFQMIDKAGQWVGDRVYELTKSPILGAGAKTGTIFMVPYALRKTGKTAAKVSKQAVGMAKSAYDIASMVRESKRQAYSKQAVGESLRKNIGETDMIAQDIARAAEIETIIPELQFTLAEATGKPSMMVRERSLAEQKQTTFDIAKTRRAENERALEDFRAEHFGDASAEISSILKNSKGSIENATRALDDRLIEIDIARTRLANKAPQMDFESVGKKLRTLEEAEYTTAKAIGEILYNKVGNAKVNPRPIIDELGDIFRNELLDFSVDQIPTSFKSIQRKLMGKKETTPPKTAAEAQKTQDRAVDDISFDSLRSLEKFLNRDLASEVGKLAARDRTKEHLITRVLDKVKEVKNNLEKTGDADVVQALKEANTFWKEGIVDRFYKGAGRDINAKTAFNEYRIVDEKVIDSFFSAAKTSKGGVKGLDDFLNTFGMNPEAWMQLRLGVYGKFREFTGVNSTGVIDPIKATAFMNKNKVILERIPAIRGELSNLHRAALNLSDAAVLVKTRQTNINNSILSKSLKTQNPDTIVKNAIKQNPNDMKLVYMKAKKVRGGTEALSKEVGRQVLEMAERTDGSINSIKLTSILKKNAASLKLTLGREHYKYLNALHETYIRLDANKLPIGIKEPKLGLEALAEKVGTSPAQAISAWRAHSRGLIGGPHLVAQLATSFITRINKNAINAIERIAHYDKNVAQTLYMMSKTNKMTKVIETRINRHLADYGLISLSTETGEK